MAVIQGMTVNNISTIENKDDTQAPTNKFKIPMSVLKPDYETITNKFSTFLTKLVLLPETIYCVCKNHV